MLLEACSKNKHIATYSEITLAEHIAGNETSFLHHYDVLYDKKQEAVSVIGLNEQARLDRLCEKMSSAIVDWLVEHPLYSYSQIRKIYWTATPNAIRVATGNKNLNFRKNPSDIVIRFYTGQFLGVSAKTTKKKNNFSFKNPGIGTIEKSLGVTLTDQYTTTLEGCISKYNLPRLSKERKSVIRRNPDLKTTIDRIGSEQLKIITDKLIDVFLGMSQDDLRRHLLEDWFNSYEKADLPYIQVCANNSKYYVTDPSSSKPVQVLSQASNIHTNRLGNETIGVYADGTPVFTIRAKFDSQKMAGSIKFAAEPKLV